MRRLIGISPEKDSLYERERIRDLLARGKADFFHIRKPFANREELVSYLSFFSENERKRLSLHSFHDLAVQMGIGGVHFRENDLFSPSSYPGKRISVSCHTIEQLIEKKPSCDYLFLSPVFDSISKKGYKSAFSLEELETLFKKKILDDKVVALGGVTRRNLGVLEKIGFSSFALLSDMFRPEKTMFITHKNSRYDYLDGALLALEGGIRFVQLRMKDATDEQVLQTAEKLRKACTSVGALLTVDDRVSLLESGLFDGVHIGKNDMPASIARKLVLPPRLLGCTANTAEDIFLSLESKPDYIGLGPFRFTTTKQKLSPVLGLEGYRKIVDQIRQSGSKTPIYAIGGIRTEDLPLLRQAGVDGVAVSSLILQSQDPFKTIAEIENNF